MRARHAEYFLNLAEAAERELRGPPSLVWLDRLEAEYDNVRGLVRWAIETCNAELALRTCTALQRYLGARGHLGEGQRWLESALALEPPAPASIRARALQVAGEVAWLRGDYLTATAHHQHSLALWERHGR